MLNTFISKILNFKGRMQTERSRRKFGCIDWSHSGRLASINWMTSPEWMRGNFPVFCLRCHILLHLHMWILYLIFVRFTHQIIDTSSNMNFFKDPIYLVITPQSVCITNIWPVGILVGIAPQCNVLVVHDVGGYFEYDNPKWVSLSD